MMNAAVAIYAVGLVRMTFVYWNHLPQMDRAWHYPLNAVLIVCWPVLWLVAMVIATWVFFVHGRTAE